MASTDWQGSPIGPPAVWPASLRNVVDVMFELPNPAFVVWGAQETLLYNEPFRTSVDRASRTKNRLSHDAAAAGRRHDGRCPLRFQPKRSALSDAVRFDRR